MEVDVLKAIVSKSDWLIISLFVIYLAFKIVMFLLENKKAKTAETLIKSQHTELKEEISIISRLAKNSEIKDRIIDSINQKLKIIYAQYGSELSKELAIVVIQNIYFNYASIIADEVYEMQKHQYSNKILLNNIKSRISILNDEKMQELEGFVYRDKHLITFTTGQIIDPKKIIDIIDNYAEKNGMLRTEIKNTLSIEAGLIIKRL